MSLLSLDHMYLCTTVRCSSTSTICSSCKSMRRRRVVCKISSTWLLHLEGSSYLDQMLSCVFNLRRERRLRSNRNRARPPPPFADKSLGHNHSRALDQRSSLLITSVCAGISVTTTVTCHFRTRLDIFWFSLSFHVLFTFLLLALLNYKGTSTLYHFSRFK